MLLSKVRLEAIRLYEGYGHQGDVIIKELLGHIEALEKKFEAFLSNQFTQPPTPAPVDPAPAEDAVK